MLQVSLVVGIACGWLCPPTLARKLEYRLTRCAALPAQESSSSAPPRCWYPWHPTPTSSVRSTVGTSILRAATSRLFRAIYLALKPLILWVPVGLLYALAQRQAQLTRWTIAGALAFLVVGLPLLHGTLTVQGLLEIVSAFWGIGVGVWLGDGWARHFAQFGHLAPERRPTRILPAANRSAGEAGAGQAARRIVAVLMLLGVGVWAWLFPRWGAWFLSVSGLMRCCCGDIAMRGCLSCRRHSRY